MTFFKYAASVGLLAVGLVAALSLVGGSEAAGTGVPLGTAGSFAVLAGSGITNTGATTIVGDTGSSPTNSESGFDACPAQNCVTQTGANHLDPDPNDAATQSAKLALTNAYDHAAGQTPTEIPTELAGQNLRPGVYSSASGTFEMSGTLTLNAGGNADAVFIFQTADGTGTLVTGETGNVKLIGRTQSCKVFWKVGTSATLGAGSTFRGTILAHTSITVLTGVTVDGSLMAGEQASGEGAVTLINDTISRASCAAPATTPTAPATTAAATTAATTTAPTTTTAPPAARPGATAAAAKKAAAARKATADRARRARARARAGATSTSTSITRSTSTGTAKPPLRRAGFTG